MIGQGAHCLKAHLHPHLPQVGRCLVIWKQHETAMDVSMFASEVLRSSYSSLFTILYLHPPDWPFVPPYETTKVTSIHSGQVKLDAARCDNLWIFQRSFWGVKPLKPLEMTPWRSPSSQQGWNPAPKYMLNIVDLKHDGHESEHSEQK